MQNARGTGAGRHRAAQVRAIPLARHVTGDLGYQGVLLACIGLAFTVIGLIEWRARLAANEQVSTAYGVVEALWVEHAIAEIPKAQYTYYDGRHADRVRKVEPIPPSLYQDLHVGAPVEVAFDPAIPNSGHIKREPIEGLSRVFIVMGVFGLAGGGAQLGLRARRATAMRRLVESGALLEARVTRILPTPIFLRGARQHRIEYVFFGSDGQWRTGLGAFAPRSALVRLEQGSPVHVFVDRTAPERHVLARDVLEAV